MNTWRVRGIVRAVLDGDTFRADCDLGWNVWLINRAIRVRGINAPELHALGAPNPAGLAARDYATGLLPVGMVIWIESQKLEKYGRVLGRVELPDGGDFGALMIKAGHAVPYMTLDEPRVLAHDLVIT